MVSITVSKLNDENMFHAHIWDGEGSRGLLVDMDSLLAEVNRYLSCCLRQCDTMTDVSLHIAYDSRVS